MDVEEAVERVKEVAADLEKKLSELEENALLQRKCDDE